MLACVTNTCIACLSTKPKMTPSSLSKTHSEHSHHTPTTTFPRSRRNTSSIKKRQEGCMYWHHKAIFILRYNKPTWVTLQGSPTSNAKTHTHTHTFVFIPTTAYMPYTTLTPPTSKASSTRISKATRYSCFLESTQLSLTPHKHSPSLTHSLIRPPPLPTQAPNKHSFSHNRFIHTTLPPKVKKQKWYRIRKKPFPPLPLLRRRRGGREWRQTPNAPPPSRVILFRIRFFSIENTFL